MALAAGGLTGSLWEQAILIAVHTVMPVTAGLVYGLPIEITTRYIPLHLPTVLTENQARVLLGTFDGIPLYSDSTLVANNVLRGEYPDGTGTNFACVQ
jgi:hypothetical protein